MKSLGEGTIGVDGSLVNYEFVSGKSTSLVGVKKGDTSQLFDGSDMSDDNLVLGKLLGTNSKGDRQDSSHSDGNSTNQENQGVAETTAIVALEPSIQRTRISAMTDMPTEVQQKGLIWARIFCR